MVHADDVPPVPVEGVEELLIEQRVRHCARQENNRCLVWLPVPDREHDRRACGRDDDLTVRVPSLHRVEQLLGSSADARTPISHRRLQCQFLPVASGPPGATTVDVLGRHHTTMALPASVAPKITMPSPWAAYRVGVVNVSPLRRPWYRTRSNERSSMPCSGDCNPAAISLFPILCIHDEAPGAGRTGPLVPLSDAQDNPPDRELPRRSKA